MRAPWEYEDPSCASVGGDFWFPDRESTAGPLRTFNGQSEEVKIAASICGSCIHKTECQQWGLKHEHHGIWGGLTEAARRPIRKRLNIIVEEVGVVNFTTGVGNSPYESHTST